MALPATESFTNSNDVQLTTHSANWTLNNGDFDIQSNALANDAADTQNLAHWNADAFADDQYAESTRTDVSYYELGVAVRCAASAHTGYIYVVKTNGKRLRRWIAGASTVLATSDTGASNDDIIRLEASGTTITPILNGSTDSDLGAQTDSSIESGSAGVCGYADSTGDLLDDWEGGNLGGGGSASESASESASPSLSESASPSLSESASPSLSESASESISPSLSESVSPSISESVSPSLSESVSPSLSESASPSLSESASESVSPSLSESASESVSPSLSESASESISPSLSESASESVSPSLSESASPSLSESVSPILSESASPSPGPTGDVCWGHVTGVLETNVLPFNGNWTGTGEIENPGANDNERLALEAGENMISEMVNTGVITCEILQNEYAVGDDVTLEYRDGATAAICNAAAWGAYGAPFESLGFVQIRVTSTL